MQNSKEESFYFLFPFSSSLSLSFFWGGGWLLVIYGKLQIIMQAIQKSFSIEEESGLCVFAFMQDFLTKA